MINEVPVSAMALKFEIKFLPLLTFTLLIKINICFLLIANI